jgi:hypothetical protein
MPIEARRFCHSPTLPTQRTHVSEATRRSTMGTHVTGGGSMTELTQADDAVLDATLVKLFADHEAAMQTGDNQAKAETHWAIAAVIEEQSRRLDAWIEEHMSETA